MWCLEVWLFQLSLPLYFGHILTTEMVKTRLMDRGLGICGYMVQDPEVWWLKPQSALEDFSQRNTPKRISRYYRPWISHNQFRCKLAIYETVHHTHYTASKLHFETKVQIGVSKYLLQMFHDCTNGGTLVATTCGVWKHLIFTILLAKFKMNDGCHQHSQSTPSENSSF